MSVREIIILTGDLSSGKTSLCLEIAKVAKEKGLDVAGMISPAVFTGSQKTAIDALDLRSWKRNRMAELHKGKKSDLETKRWSFDPSVVAWGNQVLADATPCDLLIIDELGPLEFERNEGWTEGFSALDEEKYKAAIVVVRPSLIDAAEERWLITRKINLDLSDQIYSTGEDIIASIDFHDLG